jgi:Hyphally regulated cell wall protein N-terminal
LLTIGGKLVNSGLLEIGYSELSAPATVDAASLANVDGASYGTILLEGTAAAQATLDVGSAAGFGGAGVLYGFVGVDSYYGDALIEFASGQITTIAGGGELNLTGSHAFVADASDTSANSALGLRTVVGTLQLDSGAALATPGGLTNSGAINLDWASEDGGSLLTIGGTLTNSGTIQIGSGLSPTAGSTLEAAKVVNDGTINLAGAKGVRATLHTGAFTNDGSVALSHDTDTIGGAVSGTGDFSLSRSSTLTFVHGVSNGEMVTFGSGVNHLDLGSPSSFSAMIDDFFTAGDSVLAKTFAEAATLLTYTQTGADSCSWTLTDSMHTAVLDFAGAPYAQSDFSISPSANGATLIKFV